MKTTMRALSVGERNGAEQDRHVDQIPKWEARDRRGIGMGGQQAQETNVACLSALAC